MSETTQTYLGLESTAHPPTPASKAYSITSAREPHPNTEKANFSSG